MLGDDGIKLCINLDVPIELVTQRLSSRRVCQECGTTYKDTDIEAISGTCSNCGGDVIQRTDDYPEAIRTRLMNYERDTEPLLSFYASRGLLVTVDGDQSPDEVTDEIMKAGPRTGPGVRRSADELDKMRKAGKVVAEMHEATRAAIRPGVTTHAAQRGRGRGAGQARRAIELPQLPRLPGRDLHQPQRHDRARHPRGLSRCARVTSSRSTAGRSSRAITATPPTPPASATISDEATRLIDVTERQLWAGIDQLKKGNRLNEVGRAVQKVAEAAGYSVVREYVGHAIGTAMHESPRCRTTGRARPGRR